MVMFGHTIRCPKALEEWYSRRHCWMLMNTMFHRECSVHMQVGLRGSQGSDSERASPHLPHTILPLIQFFQLLRLHRSSTSTTHRASRLRQATTYRQPRRWPPRTSPRRSTPLLRTSRCCCPPSATLAARTSRSTWSPTSGRLAQTASMSSTLARPGM